MELAEWIAELSVLRPEDEKKAYEQAEKNQKQGNMR